MSQKFMNQKSDADESKNTEGKQSSNGGFKHFFKQQPLGIALAMILIVLLSGTTFVVGKASVSKTFCIFCQPTVVEGSSSEWATIVAIGVGAIALWFWWVI